MQFFYLCQGVRWKKNHPCYCNKITFQNLGVSDRLLNNSKAPHPPKLLLLNATYLKFRLIEILLTILLSCLQGITKRSLSVNFGFFFRPFIPPFCPQKKIDGTNLGKNYLIVQNNLLVMINFYSC